MTRTVARYPRYALYFVPTATAPLYRMGAAALGYDAFTGEAVSFPGELLEAVPAWSALTEAPRVYGFHATLKAPFALAEGRTESDLIAAFDAFAQTPRGVPTVAPILRSLSHFIAVVPAKVEPPLNDLAAACVREFEPFRAPLTPDDRARRHPDRLSARQVDYLDRYGYPHIFEDFRFHMTLTGRLDDQDGDRLLATLETYLAPVTSKPFAVDHIALSRQDRAGARFTVLRHSALTPKDSA